MRYGSASIFLVSAALASAAGAGAVSSSAGASTADQRPAVTALAHGGRAVHPAVLPLAAKTYAPPYGFGTRDAHTANLSATAVHPVVLPPAAKTYAPPYGFGPSHAESASVVPASSVVEPGEGFSWTDAGIGAGVALAAAALLVGVALQLRRMVAY
jgi:hypothetical protein